MIYKALYIRTGILSKVKGKNSVDIEISEKPLTYFFYFFKRWQIITQPRRKNRKINDCHE